MNELKENLENQSMQDQLDRDPDYIAWEKSQEKNIDTSSSALEALIKETKEISK